jgi:hypothetical protein
MPPQIMWPEMDPHQFTCLYDHQPCGFIRDRENSILRRLTCTLDIFSKSVSNLLRDKDDLMLFAAFW